MLATTVISVTRSTGFDKHHAAMRAFFADYIGTGRLVTVVTVDDTGATRRYGGQVWTITGTRLTLVYPDARLALDDIAEYAALDETEAA